jgi:hypothetical protein
VSTSADVGELADEFAADAAAFVAAVESVAAGDNPGAAVAVLLLGLSGLLAGGAKLGAMEDAGPVDPGWSPSPPASATTLGAALADVLGAVDEYHEVVDPYLGDEVATARLSQDLAGICGDLLDGLACYTAGAPQSALALWQRSYLASWGPTASACLRAVQSLIALIRLGAPLGEPRDEAVDLG